MSWLTLDDNYAQSRKFSGWSPAEKWALLELKLFCARTRSGGHVPSDLSLLPRPITRKLLVKAERGGWLERDESGELWVHDWHRYNGTTEERVGWFLRNHPSATANDVQKAVGGNRQAVQQAVRSARNGNGSIGTGA